MPKNHNVTGKGTIVEEFGVEVNVCLVKVQQGNHPGLLEGLNEETVLSTCL
jgi:hypothetical protein